MEQEDAGPIAAIMRQASFTGLPGGTGLFVAQVLALLRPGDDRRILDLGSGWGDVAMQIHASQPALRVTGIDLSPANVEAARMRANGTGIDFVCADYMAWQGGGFEMIVADSVLHLVDAPVSRLAAKLAADLLPGGVVLATVPDAALLNRIHLLFRRLWQLTPRGADRLALALAARLYPGLPRQALADRLPYLRLMPHLFGKAEQLAFAAAGLHPERCESWPSSSVMKPHHQLMMWRRVTQ